MDVRFVTAASLGAVAALLYGKDIGEEVSSSMISKDRQGKWRRFSDFLGKASHDMRNRSIGLVKDLRYRVEGARVGDDTLVRRVAAKIGRYVSHPRAVGISADNGVVVLSGPILEREVRQTLKAIRSVPGVREVQHEFEIFSKPGNIPDLQGGKIRYGERIDMAQINWAPATRLLLGTLGAGLAVNGIWKGKLGGAAQMVAGTALLGRSMTNVPYQQVYRQVRADAKEFLLSESMDIAAPVPQVFAFFSDAPNFARFIPNVQSVEETANGRFHWVAKTSAGEMKWDTTLVRYEPPFLIGWQSTDDSPIGHLGEVQFEDLNGQSTRVTLKMSFADGSTPSQRAKAWLAFAHRKKLHQELVKVKSLLENEDRMARTSSFS